jgi:hypothetical protein
VSQDAGGIDADRLIERLQARPAAPAGRSSTARDTD